MDDRDGQHHQNPGTGGNRDGSLPYPDSDSRRTGDASTARGAGGAHPGGAGEPYPGGAGEAYPGSGAGDVRVVERPRGGAGMGIAALVLGVLGLLSSWFLLGAVLGLIAIILGVVAWNRARRINGAGRGMGIAGAILGVLSIVIAGVVLFAGVSFLNDNPETVDCVRDANGDQAKIQQCQDQLVDKAKSN